MDKKRIAACAVILFSMSLPVLGQGYRVFQDDLDDIVQRTKFMIGPFRIFPSIQLRDIGYDDNVHSKTRGSDLTSDFKGRISPVVRIYVLFRNQLILSFTENPEYLFFIKERDESALTHSYSSSFRLKFFGNFVVSGNYHRRSQRERSSSEIDKQINDLVRGYTLRIFYETARKTSFGLSGDIDEFLYEDVYLEGQDTFVSTQLNRREKSARFEWNYRIFTDSYLFYTARYATTSFKNPRSVWRDAHSLQMDVGVYFPVWSSIRGMISFGIKKFTPKTEESKGFIGFVSNSQLSWRRGRFNFRLGFSRNSHFSYQENVIFFVDNRYHSGVSFYLTKYLRLDYNFTHNRLNYPKSSLIPSGEGQEQDILRRDVHNTHALGFAFRVIRNTGLGLMYNAWRKRSNYPGKDLNRNSIGVYLTYEF